MIKPWVFEFLYAPDAEGEAIAPETATAVFDKGVALWQRLEALGFEGIFFSEHHFGVSYSPSPNILIAAIARSTRRLRLGTMGMVLPLYQPWRVLEEIGMLDHLTGGRLEIGCASGIPQEIARIGVSPQENRERFDETLAILDAWLAGPAVSHRGRHYNLDNLRIVPRPRQQPPPKWTTVVSTASAIKSAGRGSKICTAFESVERIAEIFDAYRAEAGSLGLACSPDDLAIRRNVSVAGTESEARELSAMARAVAAKVIAGDPRVKGNTLLDAPVHAAAGAPAAGASVAAPASAVGGQTAAQSAGRSAGPGTATAGGGFSVHEDEFIAGTPSQVAEQIIAQCRATGAGHILAILGRVVDEHRLRAVELFGAEVIPVLRRAGVGDRSHTRHPGS